MEAFETELRKILPNRIGKNDIQKIVTRVHTLEEMEVVLQFLTDEEKRVRTNAAWVATHFPQQQIDLLQPKLNQFIDLVLSSEEVSLRRLVLTIIEKLEIKSEDLRTDFLDFCLSHMLLPQEAPGVQTLCMKLAYRQCQFYPELLNEFKEYLSSIDNGYAICIKSLRKKMLKILG